MTVQELIALLEIFPPSAKVVRTQDAIGGCEDIHEVEFKPLFDSFSGKEEVIVVID